MCGWGRTSALRSTPDGMSMGPMWSKKMYGPTMGREENGSTRPTSMPPPRLRRRCSMISSTMSCSPVVLSFRGVSEGARFHWYRMQRPRPVASAAVVLRVPGRAGDVARADHPHQPAVRHRRERVHDLPIEVLDVGHGRAVLPLPADGEQAVAERHDIDVDDLGPRERS